MKHHEQSTFLHKEPCPSCGSKDNLARYSDGHAHCFGCNHYEPGEGQTPQQRKPRMASGLIQGGEYEALTKRGISEETCRKFGYQVARLSDGRKVQLAPYYDATGNLVAQKVRPASKDEMFATGDMSNVLLFGQQLWADKGRKVVITEGELDAMSVSQVQGNKWPVVSIPKGSKAAKKELGKHLEWLNTFEEVVLMFDMDEAGREAVAECAPILPPGKCKIATLPMKDASDMLQAGKGDQIVTAIWQAKTYRPDGIVTFGDLREAIMREPEMGLPWFLPTLTGLTYGRRCGELYAFGAGTGVGKTDLFTQQMQYDIVELGEKVGIFSLEQQPAETAKRLLGKLAGKRFHIPDGSWKTEDLAVAYEEMESTGKVFFYDSFGATDWDRIRDTIRFLAHSEGVRLFYLDHLTALAAAEDDERKALERIMAEMGGLVKELDIVLHIISHLATPEGTPHEEGGRVMIRHFKGSRAIGFWCHFMFGMERNQQDEDEVARKTTTFRVLKDRHTGRATGEVIYLGYEDDTGRLFETTKPEPTQTFSDETGGPADF